MSETMGALLVFALVSGVPFILGIAFGWWLRARLRPNAKLDTPATARQRSYLADLAERPGAGESLAALAITEPWVPSLTRDRASAAIDRIKTSADG